MTTYPLTFPSVTGQATVDLVAMNVAVDQRSPTTLAGQVQTFSGQAWQLNVNLPALTQTQANVWWAWLVSLRGPHGTFLAGNLTHCNPAGAAGGTPLVNGSNQTGPSLSIKGASVSTTDWLKAGDFIQLGSASSSSLHMILEDAATNSSGEATLSIWPSLRTPPEDESSVTTSSPAGVFRLSDSSVSRTRRADGKYAMSFSAMEAI